MKRTKRILCLLTAALLTVALCACGGDKPAQEDNGNGTTTTTGAISGNLSGENQYNDGTFSEW